MPTMFTAIRSLFAKPVTVESVRAELALVVTKRAKARAKAARSPLAGGFILDPFAKVAKLARREAELRVQLAELGERHDPWHRSSSRSRTTTLNL